MEIKNAHQIEHFLPSGTHSPSFGMRARITCAACVLAVLLGVRWQYPESSFHPATKQLIISTDLSAGIAGPHGGCAHCNPQLVYPLAGSWDHNFFINYRPQVVMQLKGF